MSRSDAIGSVGPVSAGGGIKTMLEKHTLGGAANKLKVYLKYTEPLGPISNNLLIYILFLWFNLKSCREPTEPIDPWAVHHGSRSSTRGPDQ